MSVWLAIALILFAALVLAIVITALKVVWLATGNLIDWIVETFGNDKAKPQ